MTGPTHALLLAGALGAALIASAAAAAPRDLPDRLPNLLVDADGARCSASVQWDQQKIHLKSAQEYLIQCGTSVGTRGRFARREVPDEGKLPCGPETDMPVPGLGATRARLCADASGEQRIELVTRRWRGWADKGAAGPLVVALRIAEAGAITAAGTPIDKALFATLVAPPMPAGTGKLPIRPAAARADVQTSNQLGLQNIYAGRNVEAAQLLRDAIAAYAGGEPQQLAQLRLNAALAESNVGDFASADDYLAAADTLIADIPSDATRAGWSIRAQIYRALHLINQNRWAEAQALLERTGPGASPLRDPLVLAQLNRVPGTSIGQAIDPELLNALILQVQARVALSQAQLRLGQTAAAQTSLDAAGRFAHELERSLTEQAPISRDSVNWLLGRIERQQGRLFYARGDVDRAIASFDCAVADLQAVPLPQNGTCLFTAARPLGVPVSGPAIADAQLERATFLEAKTGVDRATVLAAYQRAVETLESFPDAQAAPSPLLGHYLDLLIADGSAVSTDRFLRALQTVHVPAIARQIKELQLTSVVGTVGDRLRERQALESRRVQLAARIPQLAAGDPEIAADQGEMDYTVARIRGINDQLRSDPHFAQLEDTPVTAAELQATLRPGEIYWRLAAVGRRVFGAAVAGNGATIYAVKPASTLIAEFARRVMTSVTIDENGHVGDFDTAAAAVLFAATAGDAVERLRTAHSVIVDSADVLHGVPPAILVTRPFTGRDYPTIPFLVRQADLATAASPRSFVQLRVEVRPSQAPNALIGFGDNAPPPALPPGTPVQISLGCVKTYGEYATNLAAIQPISTREIGAGARALGDPSAPILTGARFTDVGMLEAGRDGTLAKYQILHFATHGLPSRAVAGCAVPIAPSLLTSIAPPAADQPRPSLGLLSFIDIAQLNLDANLVVLSACDTAAEVSATLGRLGGQEDAGTAFDGLIRAFFLAHARAVIATSWSIPSNSAEDVMAVLYQTGRTQTIGASLRAAQLAVLANPHTAHPVFWGAFFLVGDGAKHMLTQPAPAAPAAAE